MPMGHKDYCDLNANENPQIHQEFSALPLLPKTRASISPQEDSTHFPCESRPLLLLKRVTLITGDRVSTEMSLHKNRSH